MNERSDIDDIVLFLAYAYTKNALYMMDVMNMSAKEMMVDKDMTPKSVKRLKADYNLTTDLAMKLKAAGEGYSRMIKNLEMVESALDNHVRLENYNWAQAECEDIAAFDVLLLGMIDDTDDDYKKRDKVFNYLKKFKMNDSVIKGADQLRRNAASLRNESKFLKDNNIG